MKIKLIEDFISFIVKSFPNVGYRSAQKIAIKLISNQNNTSGAMIDFIVKIQKELHKCIICNNSDTQTTCSICSDTSRESTVCVVKTIADLWNIEKANIFKGKYFIIDIESRDYSHLVNTLNPLMKNIEHNNSKEVILAFGTTTEDQTLIYFFEDIIKQKYPDIQISIPRQGIPSGSEIDYLDSSTIATAILNREIR